MHTETLGKNWDTYWFHTFKDITRLTTKLAEASVATQDKEFRFYIIQGSHYTNINDKKNNNKKQQQSL